MNDVPESGGAGPAPRAPNFSALGSLEAPAPGAALARLAEEDPALAADVERMLKLDRVSQGPIEALRSEVDEAAERRFLAPPAAPRPERLGAWRLGERLGAGGMGEVWAAERVDGGFTQSAAIKLVRSGMASHEIVQRFQVERQLLARLDHPSIAKLLDGGIAPDERPWFAMERVEGVPITRFAEENGLDIEARLRLFLAVAEAVDFAHRSLVVHRDLKPSNILVTGEGTPKLLDFGLAKLVEPLPGVDPYATRTEFRALTPAYAAPEQIRGEPVTTATDVYALGVILYELLTGELPHRRRTSSPTTLVLEVAQETIERPSQRLRRLESGSPRETWRPKRLEGDLDTIVLKALASDRDRRYPSAAALAQDIVAHLEGRPIAARPDALGYRLSKFVSRHRLGVAAAVLVLAAIVAGATVALVQARRAELAARRAERVKALLVEVFLGADPHRARGEELTARKLLEEGASRVERDLGDEPEVQAELLTTLAMIEDRLGLLEPGLGRARRALALAEKVWGGEDPRLLAPLAVLGGLLLQLEQSEEALAVGAAALALARKRFAPDALEVARAEHDLVQALFAFDRYAEALPIAEHALAVRRKSQGEDHLETINAKLAVAYALDFLDRTEESIVLGRDVLTSLERAVGPDDPRTLEAHHNLAVSLSWMGRNREALVHFGKAIEGRRRVLGGNDFRLAWSLQQSSLALRDLERYDEADRATEEAIRILRAIDPLHQEAVNGLQGLGSSALARGDFAGAAARFREAADAMAAAGDSGHRVALAARSSLALALAGLGGEARLEEAALLARETLAARERAFGAESAYAAGSWHVLGEVERARSDPRAALEAHTRARAIASGLFGEAHATTVRAGLGLALDHLALGTPEDLVAAEAALTRAGKGQLALDAEHSRRAEIDLALARLAAARGDTAKALEHLERARQRFVDRLGAAHPQVDACDLLRSEILASS